MNGKTHHNLMVGVGWRSSYGEMATGGATKERKERKTWESKKKKKRAAETVGMGEKDFSLH
jgi:hypothetical protein